MESNMASDKKRDDIRRTTRIIQIDEMLRGGAFVGMDELIFKFGVNKRTVERLRDEMNACKAQAEEVVKAELIYD
ncbi:hypothetical protein [Treponema succinifaciens]|uniref:hypothetical protein n=1 Tax=Treponema succinifaciens TaxID=167 RepID=UPI0023EF57C8|nr:hypothetical protein [Treponema succinifaciens]